jgi:hypothetical protein
VPHGSDGGASAQRATMDAHVAHTGACSAPHCRYRRRTPRNRHRLDQPSHLLFGWQSALR